MKQYPIPYPLLQEVVNYLQTKPWVEVNSMLIQIGNVAKEVDATEKAADGSSQ